MDIKELKMNPFTEIGEDWALVSAGGREKANTMTVSWGGVGVFLGKNVVFAFIRDSRYTKEFIDSGETFSLSFLSGEYRNALALCGSTSGRDIDKWKETGLTPVIDEGTVYPKEAKRAFLCRKIAAVPVEKESFIDGSILPQWYAQGDFHTMYVGEIIKVI